MIAAFLASKYASGMSHILPADPGDLRTVFIPTAGRAYASSPWIDTDREWLKASGFTFTNLDLSEHGSSEVEAALDNADLLYVAGGNTYFLLHHMRRSGFLDMVADLDILYVGVSAGAIVLCPDISYIDDLDERKMAPDLNDTTAAGILDFRILPHVDDVRVASKNERILANWPEDVPLVKLTDQQAIYWKPSGWRVVDSPKGRLAAMS